MKDLAITDLANSIYYRNRKRNQSIVPVIHSLLSHWRLPSHSASDKRCQALLYGILSILDMKNSPGVPRRSLLDAKTTRNCVTAVRQAVTSVTRIKFHPQMNLTVTPCRVWAICSATWPNLRYWWSHVCNTRNDNSLALFARPLALPRQNQLNNEHTEHGQIVTVNEGFILFEFDEQCYGNKSWMII